MSCQLLKTQFASSSFLDLSGIVFFSFVIIRKFTAYIDIFFIIMIIIKIIIIKPRGIFLFTGYQLIFVLNHLC